MKTLVVQSHRNPLPFPWLQRCIETVRDWAEASGFEYRFLDDEIFALLPGDIREKTAEQPVVASDLARLLALRDALDEGFAQTIWCDADFLIFDPQRLVIPDECYALGREVWVRFDDGRLRTRVQVHNAFMMFAHGNPFLEFYIHAAQRMIRAYRGPFHDRMAPQFIGPKFLTAIHNIIQCPIVDAAGMLSPLVAVELLEGQGPGLTAFRKKSPVPPAGVNLCGSLAARGELSDQQAQGVIDHLLSVKMI